MAQLKDTLIAGNLRVTDTVIADTIKKEGGTSSQFLKADGSIDSNTYALSSAIPSAPGTLKTDNTSAQSTSASESLSGTINLHKVSKTGSYNDLLDKPTIPAVPTISTDITADASSDTKTASPKAVKTFVENKGYTTNTGTVTGVTAGAGLNTTSNDTGTDGGTINSSGTLYLTKSGVTAGTYQGITVDKYGRVTSASNQGYTTNTGTVTGVTVGTTAYTPTSGVVTIPAYPSVPVTDVTVGGTSVVSSGTAVIPAIPTVPTISTNIVSDKASDIKTASPKAVYSEVHPAIITSWPNNNSFNPNVMYQISGSVTGNKSVSLPLADLDETIPNHWYIEFNTGSTAPTINWASSIVWNGDSAPTINASKHYEISILYDTDTEFSKAVYIETEKTASS